ncbi:ThuA domain-containing protein [Thalassotalea fonticola]|uniref:ThuA domain-containing protein n=1 Tax=Thalassotalea fonticola TaxID=3065649 RepID=A0ABZ0GK87_9GAMM|nr:ThuA domain-containing protein [Colwelliaceae bacterium S1-1]
MKYFKVIINITLLSLCFLLAACDKPNTPAQQVQKTTAEIRVLYVTSVGWFHDYQQQIKLLSSTIQQSINADVDVIVGDVERLKTTDFSKGYDLLVYNFCHAAQRDEQLVQSLITPVTEKSIPAIALHCAMHSFQFDPQWSEFLGLHTLRHETQRSFNIEKVGDHELVNDISDTWEVASDELYITLSENQKTTPLLKSFGVETKAYHTQAWLYQSGKGQVIGTTLGHNEETLEDENFQLFLSNSIHYLLGKEVLAKELGPETIKNKPSKVNVLTSNVNYPNADEKKCVIHNMFSIGGEKVKACISNRCDNSDNSADNASCTAQCQQDNPWPVPETLREDCQNNVLNSPK